MAKNELPQNQSISQEIISSNSPQTYALTADAIKYWPELSSLIKAANLISNGEGDPYQIPSLMKSIAETMVISLDIEVAAITA